MRVTAPIACLFAAVLLGGTLRAEIVSNGGFESPGVEGSHPDYWTADFNSYGTHVGTAHDGAWGLHPGNGADSGGRYQDLATVPGATYNVTFWVQNFASQSGASHVRVLIGEGNAPVAIDDLGRTTTAFGSEGLTNQVFATNSGGVWSQVAFQFTATDAATRLGVYNAYLTGDGVHSINVDDVSVTGPAGETVVNGGFESPGGNGGSPANWTFDFNSYGTYSGAAHSGAWGLHPGGGANSGGRYQDLVTTPGTTYDVRLWVQNFGSAAGASHVRVLLGSGNAPVGIDDLGRTSTAFSSEGLTNQVFATSADGTWSQVAFQFTATDAATRLGLYNAYLTGDSVHSINIDGVSVTMVPEPAGLGLGLLSFAALLLIRRRKG